MRISDAKECIKALYQNTNSVTALVSERGVGKTSAYQQCCDELNIGYIGLYAAALEGPDFMGLPDKDCEKGITKYLAPQFLPTVQAVKEGRYPEKGILVLEEINRVPSDTTSVLYPLLLEKRINGHCLAEGWAIGVTMNPDTMNYLVCSLDDAMLDRFITIDIQTNLEDYLEHSMANDPNHDVLEYLKAYPEMLLVVKKSADSTSLRKAPTPRGWTKIQELMNRCALPVHLTSELVAGIVGPEAAASFYGFLSDKHNIVPALDQLLNDYDYVRPSIVELVKNNRMDMLHVLLKQMAEAFDFCPNHLHSINALLLDLPEELQVLFYKYVSDMRPDHIHLITGHSDVFAAIGDAMLETASGM